MYRYFGLILFLFFVGCANKQIDVGQKSFEKEDEYIVKALLAKSDKDYNSSIHYVNLLYNETHKNIYKKELIELSFLNKEYNQTIELSKKYLNNFKIHDETVEKYLILSMLGLKEYKKALNTSKLLLKKNRSLQNYNFIAYTYLKLKDYKNAIKYFKSMYAIKPSEDIVLEIGHILIKNLNNANEALSYYQTHIRQHGCQKRVCLQMLSIYKFMYDTPNMIAIYKKLIKKYNDPLYKKALLELYVSQKRYKDAIKLLKNSQFPKEWLLNLYEITKDYKDASKISYQLYKETKKNEYLYDYAVYKFESSKKTKKDAKELIKTLSPIVDKLHSSLAYNYLGYILIDYDFNYQKGIELVKKALKIDYFDDYIDSLAWGYYKLHKCKLAYKTIKQIKNPKAKEILEHIKKIKRCKNDTTKNHKKNRRRFKHKN